LLLAVAGVTPSARPLFLTNRALLVRLDEL
jgi:hypothetical protein